jgi:septal ring factor EnvC (AmiA/AmiB activator)
VSEAEAARLHRIRAAYRILRTQLASSGESSEADRLANARRRAAARLLLERDFAERELLADEVKQLRSAETTLRAANDTQLPAIALPTTILAPAKGTIARRFGTIVHDRSKTTLARRGIDIEVPTAAQVVAPADGVVRYAGPIRGLEHGLVLDHGDYMTIVAKLGAVAIPIGTKLVRGDRIGRAARARVYLEVRAKVGPGGLPIDPEPLLGK